MIQCLSLLSQDTYEAEVEVHGAQLKALRRDGAQRIRVNTRVEDSCEECRPLHGREVSISQALRIPLLPVKTCKNRMCFCEYEEMD